MVDLRNLKSQYEAGVLDEDSFAEAKQSLLAELTLVSGVLEKPATPPPAAAPPIEPEEDEPAPPTKSWNDVSELDCSAISTRWPRSPSRLRTASPPWCERNPRARLEQHGRRRDL
jgi:hypothetical protein